MAGCMTSIRAWLLAMLLIHFGLTLTREVFDFLGRLWALIIANFLQILLLIFAIFGAYQLRPNFLTAFLIWCPIWLGWNVFLICFWLEIGGLNRLDGYLSFYTRSSSDGHLSWWFGRTGCQVLRNLTTGQQVVQGCKLDYWFVEVAEAGVQCLLTLICFVLAIFLLLLFARKIGDRFGTIRHRDQPRITMELATELPSGGAVRSSVVMPNGGVLGSAGLQQQNGGGTNQGYHSDTTGYLNASFDSNNHSPVHNGYLPAGTSLHRDGPIPNYHRRSKQHRQSQGSSNTNGSLVVQSAYFEGNDGPPVELLSGEIMRPKSHSLDRQERRRSQASGRRKRSVNSSEQGTAGGGRRRNSLPQHRRRHRDRSRSPSQRSSNTTVGYNSQGALGLGGPDENSPSLSASTAETVPSMQPLAAPLQRWQQNDFALDNESVSKLSSVSANPLQPIQRPRTFKHVATPGIAKFEQNVGAVGTPSTHEPESTRNSRPSSERFGKSVGARLAGSQASTRPAPLPPPVPYSSGVVSFDPDPRRFERMASTPDSDCSAPLNTFVSFDPKSNTLLRYHDRVNDNANADNRITDSGDWPPPPLPPVGDLLSSNSGGIPIRLKQLPSVSASTSAYDNSGAVLSSPSGAYFSSDQVSYDSGVHTNSVVSGERPIPYASMMYPTGGPPPYNGQIHGQSHGTSLYQPTVLKPPDLALSNYHRQQRNGNNTQNKQFSSGTGKDEASFYTQRTEQHFENPFRDDFPRPQINLDDDDSLYGGETGAISNHSLLV